MAEHKMGHNARPAANNLKKKTRTCGMDDVFGPKKLPKKKIIVCGVPYGLS